MEQQKYIKILKLDRTLDSTKRYARSLENYLEKYNRSFNIVEGDYIVNVDDKNDAIRISMDLKKYKIEYFNGDELLPLDFEIKRNKGGRPRNSVTNLSTGKGMTLKKFIQRSNEEIKIKCISSTDIVKRKILTKGKLGKAVSEGKLNVIKVGSRCFFDRLELADYLKNNCF